jgi:magnesium chelatase family protein
LAYLTRPGQNLIVPYGNEMECALITKKPGHEGSRVLGAATLEEVIEFFQGKRKLSTQAREGFKFQDVIPKHLDFGRIKGQARAKRAAVISAAGGHNLLLIGPPGEGKSLLANAIPGILPQLSDPEKVLLTKIYSACGELTNDGCAVTRRPMRPIHHTASKQAIIGGGSGLARPGEVTLAHLGVLFLDEIAEFSQSTLDTLRQPIEDGEVSISRVHATVRYPCRFTLVAAMNPCPCGYFGSDQCRCQEKEVKKYQKKLSGPILDRIDLQVELERLSIDERFAAAEDNVSQKHREQVQKARSRQHNRFKDTEIPFNAAIPGGHVLELCNFSPDGQTAYKQVISENTITTRSMDRLAKVARTIADLAASETIEPVHIEEATTFVIGGMLQNTF